MNHSEYIGQNILKALLVTFFLIAFNLKTTGIPSIMSETVGEVATHLTISDDPILVPIDNYIPYDGTQVLSKDTDVIFVSFELDKVALDENFHGNAEALNHIIRSIHRVIDDKTLAIRCVQIVGMASIEGSADYNYNLGMQRAEALKRYIKQQVPSLDDEVFDISSGGEAWSELRSLVEDSEFDGKAQVLDIIKHTRNPWLREVRIKELNDGKVYQYLRDNLFVGQRVAGYMRIYYDVVSQPEPAPEQEPVEEPAPEPVEEPVPEPMVVETASYSDTEGPWRWAVKTNLLFDAALAPNVEIERWLGKNNRFSLMAEVWFPWYVWRHNSNAYEVLNIGLEARYWLTHSKKHYNRPITGWFIGAYAAGGKYDIEWKSKGDQGEYTSLGLSVGYTWRIGRNLNFEASVAGGWVAGPYRHYEGRFDDTHLIWQRNGHLSYFGPTKAKFSLVWLWPGRRGK